MPRTSRTRSMAHSATASLWRRTALLLVASAPSLIAASSFGKDSDAHLAELYRDGKLGRAPFQTFHSAPELRPPALNVVVPKQNWSPATSTRRGAKDDAPWVTFVGARGKDTKDPAAYMFDDDGELVWESKKGNVMNFQKHVYKGQDVLVWYTGTEQWPGYGHGQWQIFDNTYNMIATVEAQNTTANMTDPHDFQITRDNTAVIEWWTQRKADLTEVDGPADGWAWDCVVQEVDIETSELRFEWRVQDHLHPTETGYRLRDGQTGQTPHAAFDFAHLNSVKKDDAGNFLIGMRGPSTLYYVSGKTGEIIWRLGGKRSDFEVDKDASFYSQHDARIIGSGTDDHFFITLFDNEANQYDQRKGEAKGLILSVDRTNMKVHLKQAFWPSFKHVAPSEGSMQVLSNGNIVVGWGIVPFYSEYAPNGTLIHDVQLGSEATTQHSYRTTKHRWVGNPQTLPSFALDLDRGDRAWASWNGATEVAHWQMLGGDTPTRLSSIEKTRKTGFETTLFVPRRNEFYAVAALDRKGNCLAVSETRRWDTGKNIGTTTTCQRLVLEDATRNPWYLSTLGLIMLVVVLALRRCRRGFAGLRRTNSDRGIYTPLMQDVSPGPSPPPKDDPSRMFAVQQQQTVAPSTHMRRRSSTQLHVVVPWPKQAP